MATKKKMLQAAAGNAGGGGAAAGLNVEDVFSTYLYGGTSATQTINNGIDLAGEGGLAWFKCRDVAVNNVLFDTERGDTERLISNSSGASSTQAAGRYPTFTSTGFTLGADTGGDINYTGRDYASWTFRKAPKFFDVVTYTGDGVAGRNVSHSLGSVPGCIIVKETSSTGDWLVYHRSTAADAETDYLVLNYTQQAQDSNIMWNDTAPTSTEFTLGSYGDVNGSGLTYVAYLFAHNDGDGEFGPDGDADIIKCGSYNLPYGSLDQVDVDLGFEPQWLLIKQSGLSSSNWYLYDTMRGATQDVFTSLYANLTNAEASQGNATYPNKITPTGFSINPAYFPVSTGGSDYIYIAIRRGTKVPESGTEVFDVTVDGSGDPEFVSGFPVDMAFWRPLTADNTQISSRLTGTGRLYTNLTSAEGGSGAFKWDYMDGWYDGSLSSTYSWMWKRAPNFFDVVAYTGNSTAGHTVNHNLGVAPEMIWIKRRDSTAHWFVYHKNVSDPTKAMLLSSINALGTTTVFGTHTSSVFELDSDSSATNTSGGDYIAYLFASLDGVSKVGSYTGNGTSQTIDCGFTSGARFILVKRTDSTGNWYVWDTERGIVAGNDPHLSLNTTAAEVTSDDSIDPDSSGFIVNQVAATNINVSSASYIFYAVA